MDKEHLRQCLFDAGCRDEIAECILREFIGVILFVFVMQVSATACGQTETTKESPAVSQIESEQEADAMVLAINGAIQGLVISRIRIMRE